MTDNIILIALGYEHISLRSTLSLCIPLSRLFGYIEDRLENDLPVDGERLNGFVCLMQSILLASFAAILAAHRSEILDQKINLDDDGDATYEAPTVV